MLSATGIFLPATSNGKMTNTWTLRSTGGVSGVSVSASDGEFTLPAGSYAFQIPMLHHMTSPVEDFKLRNITNNTDFINFSDNVSISVSGETRRYYAEKTVFFTLSASKTLCFTSQFPVEQSLDGKFNGESASAQASSGAVYHSVVLRIEKLS